jgi:tetratricopeptide (TPR) repeat protein
LKKKILPLAGLAALVVLQAAVAINARLCWRAKAVVADPEAKIRVLRRADSVFPWNDAVPFELGKVYFERGTDALGDAPARDRYFGRSVASFLRSLRLNPGSAAAHFHLAQTLLYMSYLSLPAPLGYFEEYKKAAELTGHNSGIYFEVGKVLLTRWERLAPEEKDFTVGILRRMLAGNDEERLLELLETWAIDVRDYALIDRILPEDAASLRTYARFLGERSLSPEARQSALARAESLDFIRAKGELDEGRHEAEAFRPAEASARYTGALETLGSLRFYQNLTGRELIDPKEYDEVRRTARRLLAMSRIEQTRSLADEDGMIAAYLAVEDDVTALGEFESFIKERGLLAEGSTAASPIKDLQTLAFRTALDFKQNRYRDIVAVGDLLAASSLVIAPSGRPSYTRILGLVGEANLKLDYVYEAEKYLRMALEIEPDNLDVLLAIERCYGRLNEEAKAAEVRQTIDRLTSPMTVDLGGRLLRKGESFKIDLVTDGCPRTLRLDFAPSASGGRPLIDVFLDGRVVWEGNGDTGSAGFTASPRQGRVSLEMTAVGDAVTLTDITQALSAER